MVLYYMSFLDGYHTFYFLEIETVNSRIEKSTVEPCYNKMQDTKKIICYNEDFDIKISYQKYSWHDI